MEKIIWLVIMLPVSAFDELEEEAKCETSSNRVEFLAPLR